MQSHLESEKQPPFDQAAFRAHTIGKGSLEQTKQRLPLIPAPHIINTESGVFFKLLVFTFLLYLFQDARVWAHTLTTVCMGTLIPTNIFIKCQLI